MKAIKYFITIAATLFAAIAVFGQPGCNLKPAETFYLYPEGQDVDKGIEGALGPGWSNGLSGEEFLRGNGANGNISDGARIDLYIPKKPNGQMIIVCPGGAYEYVSIYNEGTYVADWMTQNGITLAVVKYRMPNGHWEVPLRDIQNAFRFCRANAEKWGIKQIGVMGFSAGGHLAATTSNMFVDEITRPDFSVLIYPVITMDDAYTHHGSKRNLLGENPSEELEERYSMEKQVTVNTPPTFLAHSTNDKGVPVLNSINYYMELVNHGVPAEMHLYPTGGHGWGFSADKYIGKGKDKIGYAREEFWASLKRWLEGIRTM